jgi:hypothetical protein
MQAVVSSPTKVLLVYWVILITYEIAQQAVGFLLKDMDPTGLSRSVRSRFP